MVHYFHGGGKNAQELNTSHDYLVDFVIKKRIPKMPVVLPFLIQKNGQLLSIF
jgi:hypothetical protein